MTHFDSRCLSRRSVLRAIAAGSGLGALSTLVTACAGGGATPAASTSTGPTAVSGKPQAAAPAAGTPAPGRVGGDVTVAQSSDATNLDPAHTTATVDGNIYESIYDRLVMLDQQNNVAPALALSWEAAADQMSWTLKLRQGVKFHDGTDFNADAVKVNIERYIDPSQNSPRKGEIPYVTGVTVVDPYTAKFELSQPFVTFMYSLTGTTGFMVSPAAITKFGADLASNPVGTGPFVFKEWIKNDHVSATRNPNYWKQGLPYLNSVSYKGIADQSVTLNGMRANNIQATYGIAAKDVATVQSDSEFQLILKPSTSVSSLRLNTAAPPFDKKELRQALSWAIDRAAIEKALYYGTGVPANTFLGPQNLGYNADIKLYTTRDTAQAKQLLAAGGQPSGYTFDAQTTNAPEALNLAQAVKSQLEEIGVTMNLQLVDGVTLLQKLVDKQFQATFVTYNGGVEPFQGFNRFFYSKSPIDVYGYASPEFDGLLQKAASTGDTQARAALYQQMTALLSEDCPWVFLRYPAQTELFRKEIQGYVFNPDGDLHLETVSLSG
jgi:peptide/nickel transport system substrate-binding protein